MKFIDIEFDDLSNSPYSILDCYNGKIVGFIIRNVISKSEVDKILTSMPNISSEFKFPNNDGLTIGATFTLYEKLPNFFQSCQEYKNLSSQYYGFNIHEKIETVLKKLSHQSQIKNPSGDWGAFSSHTIRVLHPNRSTGMQVHCGNLFHDLFQSSCEILSSEVSIYNQMSYFIMLQNGENGGELKVYNLLWDEVKNDLDSTLKKDSNGKFYLNNESELEKLNLKPNPGDMILFYGGQYFHQVNPIVGSKSRITLGGFLGFSHENKAIYYWS
jgi:hypothetical protein